MNGTGLGIAVNGTGLQDLNIDLQKLLSLSSYLTALVTSVE